MTSVRDALILTFVMAAVIFLCRAFPFLFFRDTDASAHSKKSAFLRFVEKTAPPAAMTVLALNAMAGAIKQDFREANPVLTAAAFTAAVHIWRRNPLISIFGGTALYMILRRIVSS
jgi:branched-subunit amino acid transport protein AzlD